MRVIIAHYAYPAPDSMVHWPLVRFITPGCEQTLHTIWPYTQYVEALQLNSIYQTSAVLSTHMESVTLPARCVHEK